MSNLYGTIREWANGQNGLNGQPDERRVLLQDIVARLVSSLECYSSLAELATAFHGEPGSRTKMVSQELTTCAEDAEIVLLAAYWQRFMEIRQRQRGIVG
ncbi:MAG: hypothetical protein M1358_08675 [Chloroflexi bacterium]|nr:hypothetical protein [Chloroflexota bacterium]